RFPPPTCFRANRHYRESGWPLGGSPNMRRLCLSLALFLSAAAHASGRTAFFGEVIQSSHGTLVVRDEGMSGALHTVRLAKSTHFATAADVKRGDHLFVSGDDVSGVVAARSVAVLDASKSFNAEKFAASLQSSFANAKLRAAQTSA